jgi:hypothetical protein
MVLQAGSLTRRRVFTWLAAAALMLSLGFPSARAEVADLDKAAAWRLGDQISLAGLLYAQGNQDDKVEQLLTSIKPLAEAMGVEIKPFPPRAATETETYADMLQYLLKGDGAETGQQIAQKFGLAAGLLYEVAIKSNLLLLLYEPGDDQGIGGVIQSRMTEVGLPENLWVGVVDAINNKAPQGELKSAVFKMHDDVAAYLGEQAQ